MSFVSMMRTGELPEKPWKAEAVARLFASVIICAISGGAVALAIGYWITPSITNPFYFAIAIMGALGLSGAALFILRRPWPFETLLKNLIVTMTSFYGTILLIGWATHLRGTHAELQNTTLRTLLGILCLHGIAIVFIHRFVREHGFRWGEAFGFKHNWTQAPLMGVFVAAAMVLLTWGMLSIITKVMDLFNLHVDDQLPVQMLKLAKTKLDWWAFGIATILIVPAVEETLFRGILYPAIKHAGHPRLALWGSAAAFALIHFDFVRFLPLMALALALVWLYEHTGNLLACITTHALFNAVNFVALYLQQK